MHWSHFAREILDMIVLLHRLKGNKNVHDFEEWMYLFIVVIIHGKQFIDWGSLISQQIHTKIAHFPLNRAFKICHHTYSMSFLAQGLGQEFVQKMCLIILFKFMITTCNYSHIKAT